jgi:5-(carboxyamino)imidazole ribonucleotide synthase
VKKFYAHNFSLGILGGGQLGRMFIQEAINHDVNIAVLDPAADAPCASIAHEFVCGSFKDFDTVYNFGKNRDVLTIEIEHVNIDALEQLEREGIRIYPQPSFLRMVQDKGEQKEFYRKHQIPTAPFSLITGIDELDGKTKMPFIQKMRTGGYDGKGVMAIRTPQDLERAFDVPSVIEEMVDFEKEIAVIISRNESGEKSVFPIVEMEFNPEANLVEFLFSPAKISKETAEEAQQIAHRIVDLSSFVGILAVEMFVTKDGKVLVNEMAPRPHNSGHHTIEACVTSQYEQHLRSILNLPPGDTRLIEPAVMINLLGEKGYSGPVKYEGLEVALREPGVHIHLYGKKETKPFRKMGHVTVTAPELQTAIEKARRMASLIRVIA